MQQGPYQQGTYCLVGDGNTGIDAVHSGVWTQFCGAPRAQERHGGDTSQRVKTECGADDSPTASSTLNCNYGVSAKYKRNEFTKDDMRMTIKHIKSMGHQKQS